MKVFAFNIKIGALDEFSKAFANVSNKMDRLGKKARNLGKNLSLGLSLPLAAFGTMAVRKAADFETLRTALETATGSAEEAAAEFARLQNFAATTPFQLEEVVTAFIKLKNLGLDPSQEALTAYGNTAGAMGKSLDQMIEAVADAATGEFERLKEFGIKSKSEGNKVTFTFRGVKTTVRKEAAEITEYLRRIGEVQFAGGMEKQAATIAGAFSNMQDAISNALDIVGTDIAKTLDLNSRVRLFSDTITGLAKAFNGLPAPVKEVAIWAGVAGVAIGPVVTGIGQMVIGMGLMVALAPQIAAGFATILVAAPWLALAALVVGIGVQFYRLVKAVGGVGNALKVLGALVIDVLLAPFRLLFNVVDAIWSRFGQTPGWIKAGGTPLSSTLAQQYGDETRGAGVAQARSTIAENQRMYEIQNRAIKGDKAAIEVVFKNPPPGMKTNLTSETNANVTVDQGVSMEGAY